jgi:hypothetical protein
MSDLHVCSCGTPYSLNSRDWHLKTRRHLEHQESQKQMDEIKIQSQIVEEQYENILEQPEISEKDKLLKKNRIHTKMINGKNSDYLNDWIIKLEFQSSNK